MQPATESGDVYSLAATLYALLAGRPPQNVAAAPVALEETVEVAKRPIGPISRTTRYLPIPGVNRYLMDVLMTALSYDPVDRPTAARLRDQLAHVPATMNKRTLLVADDSSSVLAHASSAVPVHSTISSSHSVAVTTTAAPDSQEAPEEAAAPKAAPAEAPQQRGRRRKGTMAMAAALMVAVTSGTAWLIGEPAPSTGPTQAFDPRPPTSTTTPDAGGNTGSGSAAQETIQLKDLATSARPFQTVQIQGTYRGGADTSLRVQREEGGQWLAFPLPTKTDKSGQFTAYVELGQPGIYQVRVVDPDSNLTSEPSVLVIEG